MDKQRPTILTEGIAAGLKDMIDAEKEITQSVKKPESNITIGISLTNNDHLANAWGVKPSEDFYVETSVLNQYFPLPARESPLIPEYPVKHLAEFFGKELRLEQQSAIARIEDRMRTMLTTKNCVSELIISTNNKNEDNLFNVLAATLFCIQKNGTVTDRVNVQLPELVSKGAEIHGSGTEILNKRILYALLELDKEMQQEKRTKLFRLSAAGTPKDKSNVTETHNFEK